MRQGDQDLTQEGLGLGTIALRRSGLTYFPSDSRTSADGPRVTKEYALDSALVFRSPYLPISSIMPAYGLVTRAYMMLPGCQERLLGLRSWAFARLKVRPELRRTRTQALAEFDYELRADTIVVRAEVRSLDGPLPGMFVMNELGADHFRSAIRDGIIGPPPTGWCPLPDGPPRLLDEEHGTTFGIDRVKGQHRNRYAHVLGAGENRGAQLGRVRAGTPEPRGPSGRARRIRGEVRGAGPMSAPVALIYPYFRTSAPNQQLFPPLGIACLASQLRAVGVDARQLDCTFRSMDDVAEDVAGQGPSIVGIYVMATLSRSAIRLLERIRDAAPEALTVAGGPLPTLYPELFAAHFELVFRGGGRPGLSRVLSGPSPLGGRGPLAAGPLGLPRAVLASGRRSGEESPAGVATGSI